jgi:hypothetical protein
VVHGEVAVVLVGSGLAEVQEERRKAKRKRGSKT